MVTWCLGLKYQVTYLLSYYILTYILKIKIYRRMKNNTVLVLQLFLLLCWLLYLHICRMVECICYC